VGGNLRICSLLPSATEILYSLGLGEQVVAVTHECDFPPEAATKPQITKNVIDHDRLSSAEIDHQVASNIGSHGSIYSLRVDMLEALKPDLIVTQELCDVCAVSYSEVKSAVKVLDGATKIVSLEPNTLNEVFDTILLLGELTDRRDVARQRVDELQSRLQRVRERVRGLPRPRVYAMEWLVPPFSGGHWVPEMVEIAGGQEVLGKPGAKSERITVERILEAAPEIVVLMPCGFSLQRTIEEYCRVNCLPGWSGQAYAVDGSAYFNRSGPRLVDGVEILAEIFHPSERGPDESNRNFKRLS
jgi:iron complex transport system substrate-binding protein